MTTRTLTAAEITWNPEADRVLEALCARHPELNGFDDQIADAEEYDGRWLYVSDDGSTVIIDLDYGNAEYYDDPESDAPSYAYTL